MPHIHEQKAELVYAIYDVMWWHGRGSARLGSHPRHGRTGWRWLCLRL
jgi:hypothetical protein